METFKASLRSDKRKTPETKTYRYLTFEEIGKLNSGSHSLILDRDGKVANVKITSVKKWVKRPREIDVKCQFGLREFFTVHAHSGHEANELIVEVEDSAISAEELMKTNGLSFTEEA